MNVKIIQLVVLCGLAIGSLSGCSAWNDLNNRDRGALIGGAGGAGVGSAVGGTTGAVLGGVAGAVGGGVLGDDMDDDDRRDYDRRDNDRRRR